MYCSFCFSSDVSELSPLHWGGGVSERLPSAWLPAGGLNHDADLEMMLHLVGGFLPLMTLGIGKLRLLNFSSELSS